MMFIDLHVRLQYRGAKARQINRTSELQTTLASEQNLDLTETLYSDLDILHIAHPEPEGIRFNRKSAQALFMWKDVEKDGIFHRNLEKQIRDAMKPCNRALRDFACIKYVIFDGTRLYPQDHTRDRIDRQNPNHDDDVDRRRRKYQDPCSASMPAKSRISYATGRSRGDRNGSSASTVIAVRSSSKSPSSLVHERESRLQLDFSKRVKESDPYTSTPTRRSTDSTSSPLDRLPHQKLNSLRNFDLNSAGLRDLQKPSEKRNSEMLVDQVQSAGSPTRVPPSNRLVPESLPTTGIKRESEMEDLNHGQLASSNMNVDYSLPSAESLETKLPTISSEELTSQTNGRDDQESILIFHDNPGKLRSPSTSTAVSGLNTVYSAKPSQKQPAPPTHSASELFRELWNIRRQRTALLAREDHLVEALKAVGQDDVEAVLDTKLLMQKVQILERSLKAQSELLHETQEKLKTSQRSCEVAERTLRNEQDRVSFEQQRVAHEVQKLGISRSRNGILKADLTACQQELQIEKEQRSILATTMDDLNREMRTPFLVPKMFDAMVKISEISCLVQRTLEN